jgi:hypothetical protein
LTRLKVNEKNIEDLEEGTEISQYLKSVTQELPKISPRLKEFCIEARPTIEGRTNLLKYFPFLQRLYEDEWVKIMIVFGRQMGKSTYDATRLGHFALTHPNSKSTFITHEDEALSVFSYEKFRDAFWMESPVAREYIKGSTYGSVSFISTKINSSVRLVTDAHNFKHIEGKSSDLSIWDEVNHQDLAALARAKEAQSFTMGAEVYTGIGGFLETEYHHIWESTDQRKWNYSKPTWRDKLEFRKSGTNRLVYDDYMLDVCDGFWRALKPENNSFHGYQMSQLDAPWIPLTKKDAVELYGLPEDRSIEWKRENYSSVDYVQHVEAGFIQGDVKPITRGMLLKCYDRTLSFLYPDEVDLSLGDVYIGVDWGGGSKTICWIWQLIDKSGPKFRLLWAEKLEETDVERQYRIISNYLESYKARSVVVDAGGGAFQVQQLQKKYGPKVIRTTYLTRPENPLPRGTEEKTLRKENRYQLDRTFSLDRIVNLYEQQKIILPAEDEEKLGWIIEQLCNTEIELVKLKSTGQNYRRYLNDPARPTDALHANNYAYIAYDMGKSREVGGGKMRTGF